MVFKNLYFLVLWRKVSLSIGRVNSGSCMIHVVRVMFITLKDTHSSITSPFCPSCADCSAKLKTCCLHFSCYTKTNNVWCLHTGEDNYRLGETRRDPTQTPFSLKTLTRHKTICITPYLVNQFSVIVKRKHLPGIMTPLRDLIFLLNALTSLI